MKLSLKDWGASTVGIEIVVAIVLGMLAGRWLDRRFEITWGTYVGLLLGLGVAVRSLLRVAARMSKG